MTAEATTVQQRLERAIDAVQGAMHEVLVDPSEVPFTPQTDLLSLCPNEARLVRNAEVGSYRSRPRVSAIAFCLKAAASLLSIAHSLLASGPRAVSLAEKGLRWRQLANEARSAGRAAYRATLVLSDSAALKAEEVPGHGAALQPPEVQRQIALREEVLEKARFYQHWNRLKADNVTASQFIEFLRPLADLDGISVAYVDKGDEHSGSTKESALPR